MQTQKLAAEQAARDLASANERQDTGDEKRRKLTKEQTAGEPEATQTQKLAVEQAAAVVELPADVDADVAAAGSAAAADADVDVVAAGCAVATVVEVALRPPASANERQDSSTLKEQVDKGLAKLEQRLFQINRLIDFETGVNAMLEQRLFQIDRLIDRENAIADRVEYLEECYSSIEKLTREPENLTTRQVEGLCLEIRFFQKAARQAARDLKELQLSSVGTRSRICWVKLSQAQLARDLGSQLARDLGLTESRKIAGEQALQTAAEPMSSCTR